MGLLEKVFSTTFDIKFCDVVGRENSWIGSSDTTLTHIQKSIVIVAYVHLVTTSDY